MDAPLLYTAENQHDGDLQAFRNWYAWRHAPDVWRLGFLSCASYRVLEGDMNIFGIYEIPSADIFHRPEYQAIPARDPHREKAAGGITRRAHTLYDQIALSGTADGVPRINADWISVIRFDAPDLDLSDLRMWAAQTEAAGTMQAPRLRAARRSAKERPNSVTDRPAWLVLAEWPSRPAAGSAAWSDLLSRFGPRLSRIGHLTGERLYPWPDRIA